jgi:membrane associated rhomboid family serine protease
MATCYKHPSRETNVSCSSCGRPICTDCMTPTQVGMRCPECAGERTKMVRLREMASVPQVTYALIAINAIVFLTEGNLTLSSSGIGNSVYLKGALLGSSAEPPLASQGVAHGQLWRIVTGGFLHENLLHIGFNMYLLYLLGNLLEPVLGHRKFALVYAVSLLAGSFGALLVSPHELTVGASGAVFGLMGATAVELRSRRASVMQGIGFLILINLVLSFTIPGISWGGHVGGLIGGTLAALMIKEGERRRAQALAIVGCLALGAACFAASIATSNATEVEPATQEIQFSPP